jgi:hypothetical protein
LAYHRIYRYTSIGRPLKPAQSAHKAVLVLMLAGALVGAVSAWIDGLPVLQLLQRALSFMLIAYGSWALARELDPDDQIAAFIGMAAGMFAALVVDAPGLLIVFTTLALARMVNRSSGLAARKSDSFVILLFVFLVMYLTDSPFYGIVAGIAFILDGSLREPLRHQWVFGLTCFGGTIVYMVDHDTGFDRIAAPESLFAWMSLLFLLIFALNTLLLKKVHSKGDANEKKLDPGRVRGAMMTGLFAAVQGIYRPEEVVIIVAVISGICFGMAFRKGFKAPVSAR